MRRHHTREHTIRHTASLKRHHRLRPSRGHEDVVASSPCRRPRTVDRGNRTRSHVPHVGLEKKKLKEGERKGTRRPSECTPRRTVQQQSRCTATIRGRAIQKGKTE
ncbi:MAG TPA: hypothetical protein ACHBY4_10045 [Arsenophonus apicola]